MRDFTYAIYDKLLSTMVGKDVQFKTVADFVRNPVEGIVILRNDVDYRKTHALDLAVIQNKYKIRGTFYFRIVNGIFDEAIIKEIHSMGHEVGYHYEDLDLAGGRQDLALDLFADHLKRFRDIVPIDTICMHGSPLSKYDNRDLWKDHSYKDFGIIAEPYFDLDFNNILYLTDTGGKWDGDNVSIRDKVTTDLKHKFKTTFDIIDFVETVHSNHSMMINFHPHRWSDDVFVWMIERYSQKVKNVAKFLLLQYRSWLSK